MSDDTEIPKDVADSVADMIVNISSDDFKPADETPTLNQESIFGKCQHNNFTLSMERQYVTCGKCGDKLSPMWVLHQYARYESTLRRSLRRLQGLIEEAKSKVRCKCKHCGKMTPVVRGR